jgi:DNA mismatch endonuclease (patch repair protein)
LAKTKYKFDTTEERSKLMSKIRGTNTAPEILLRKELWKLGFRYRLHATQLKGKPDIVLHKYKTVIFIDGDFWHGYNWAEKRTTIKANRQYWINKIERNMERDKENNVWLLSQGYHVMRFWEHQVKKNLTGCVKKIVTQIIKTNY